MEYRKETKKDEHICPFCGEKMARIVPTRFNLRSNPLVSDKTEAFLCFNYSCPKLKDINFHKDKYWTWG